MASRSSDRWARSHVLAAGAAVWLTASASWAQAPDVDEGTQAPVAAHESEAHAIAQARALYEEGVAAVENSQFDLAVDRFRRAQSLRPSAATAFNLAAALERLGKLVEAAEHLRAMLHDQSTPPAVRDAAQALLSRIEPRLATLTIRLSGSRERVEVQLDGQPLTASQLDVGMPVDPGKHEAAALRDGERVAESSVEAAEGASVEVALQLPDPPPPVVLAVQAPPSALAPSPPVDRASEDESILTKWWFWTAVAVVAGGTVATVLVVSADGTPDPVSGDFMPGVLAIGR